MKERKDKREESAWVMVARYSEIGFMIPASVLVGYFLGWVADRYLHTHWLYLVGIIIGAISGFASMIKKALESSKDEGLDDDGKDGGQGGDGSNAG